MNAYDRALLREIVEQHNGIRFRIHTLNVIQIFQYTCACTEETSIAQIDEDIRREHVSCDPCELRQQCFRR